MVERLRSTAQRRGQTVNEFARSVVGVLVGLSGEQICEIPEPDSEGTNQRLSLYLGDDGLQLLTRAATASGLNPSSTLRRTLNAVLTRNLIAPVQTEADSVSVAPIFVGIVLLILFFVLGAIVQIKTASEQQGDTS